MSTPLVRTARWAALGGGIAYGIVHRCTLSTQAADKREKAEYARKEQLIAKAKAEYARRYTPAVTSDVVTDPDNPAFDLEKFLTYVEKNQA